MDATNTTLDPRAERDPHPDPDLTAQLLECEQRAIEIETLVQNIADRLNAHSNVEEMVPRPHRVSWDERLTGLHGDLNDSLRRLQQLSDRIGMDERADPDFKV